MATHSRTISSWRTAGETGDAEAAAACLAADVVAVSPLTERFRFHGKAEVADMLAAAFECIHGIRYHTELGGPDAYALFYHARAGREPLEEAQLLRLDEDGLIRELTLFGRPLPALTRVMADIGPRLLRRQGRPTAARLIGAATAPLAAFTRIGERRIVPMADPAKRRPS